MSTFEVGLLVVIGIAVVALANRWFLRWRRVDRAELKGEPGSIVTDPVHGAWAAGRPGQAGSFYTGEASSHVTDGP
jgi:hypothetical protein